MNNIKLLPFLCFLLMALTSCMPMDKPTKKKKNSRGSEQAVGGETKASDNKNGGSIGQVLPSIVIDTQMKRFSENAKFVDVELRLSQAATQGTSVQLLLSGSAVNGSDYKINQLVNIPAGRTSHRIYFEILEDEILEGNEFINIELVDPRGLTLGNQALGRIEIIDNEMPVIPKEESLPQVSLQNIQETLQENHGMFTFNVSLSKLSSKEVQVDLFLVGSATKNEDFLINERIIIPPGTQSQVVQLTIVDDKNDEPNEKLYIGIAKLVNGTNGSSRLINLSIIDNDEKEPVRECRPGQKMQVACRDIPNFIDAGLVEKTCNNLGKYVEGRCQASRCVTGYALVSGSCTKQECTPNSSKAEACADQIPNALIANLTRTCDANGFYKKEPSQCRLVSCKKGYQLSNGQCTLESLDGKALHDSKCLTCHTAKKGYNLAEIKKSFEDIAAMKQFLTMPEREIQAIAEYLVSFKDKEKIIDSNQAVSIEYRQPLGAKRLMMSKLNWVFNSPTRNGTITNTINLINDQLSTFGGTCSLYYENCPGDDIEASQAQMLGTPNILRSGFMSRLCHEVLGVDQAVANALRNANVNETSAISGANVDKVFEIFFPGREISSEIREKSINLFNAAKSQGMSNREGWRYILYGMCISPTFVQL